MVLYDYNIIEININNLLTLYIIDVLCKYINEKDAIMFKLSNYGPLLLAATLSVVLMLSVLHLAKTRGDSPAYKILSELTELGE